MANGSARELDYVLLLARDLGHQDDVNYASLISALDEVKRMLASLIESVSAQ